MLGQEELVEQPVHLQQTVAIEPQNILDRLSDSLDRATY